jgi:hypothetical protein
LLNFNFSFGFVHKGTSKNSKITANQQRGFVPCCLTLRTKQVINPAVKLAIRNSYNANISSHFIFGCVETQYIAFLLRHAKQTELSILDAILSIDAMQLFNSVTAKPRKVGNPFAKRSRRLIVVILNIHPVGMIFYVNIFLGSPLNFSI